jgi:hypothetical protein
VGEPCAACGAPLADDQRYCLECGERRASMSSVLLGGPPSGVSPQPPASPTAPPSLDSATADGARRGNAVTVIAGVGVLLLAMGVGVLIGRADSPKQTAAPAQVISVAQPGATSTGAAPTPTTTTPEVPAAKSGSPSKQGSKGSQKGASGTRSSESHPAAPTVLKNLSKKKGKSYEQESKNLPNVISTG